METPKMQMWEAQNFRAGWTSGLSHLPHKEKNMGSNPIPATKMEVKWKYCMKLINL